MNGELSLEIWFVVLRGDVSIGITEEEYGFLKRAIQDKSIEFFEIKGKLIMKNAVLYVVPAKDMEVKERKSRGEWQCEKGHWNDRGAKKCEGGKGHCYF